MGLTGERDNTCFSVIACGKDCLKDNTQKFCQYVSCHELELQVQMELDGVASSAVRGTKLSWFDCLFHTNILLLDEYFTLCNKWVVLLSQWLLLECPAANPHLDSWQHIAVQ